MDQCTHLPAEPLKRKLLMAKGLHGASWEEFGHRIGVSSRTLLRVMSAATVSPCIADRMSIRLGLHPALIWPIEWGRASRCLHQTESQELGGIDHDRA